VMTDVVATAVPHIRAGKARALAVTTLKRSSQLPDVPTLHELGFSGFDASSEVSLLAPKGTPREVIARLNAELNKALQTAEVRSRLASIGAEPEGGAPERLGERVRLELQRWGKVIRDAQIAAP
jgi:tripartite-type tricarboxylate transporter receptor subunit TctC